MSLHAVHDDDPTRALDDFVRRLRPSADGEAMPDLTGLADRLHRPAGFSGSAEWPRAKPSSNRLRSGLHWDANDVVDVVDLPAPEALDVALGWDAEVEQRAIGGSALSVLAQETDGLRPTADAAGAPGAAPSPGRRLAQWAPGAWMGACTPALPARTVLVQTPQGTVVETHPPQALMALWAPSAGATANRWPTEVWLADLVHGAGHAALLAAVPGAAPLWVDADAAGADWALLAELVLLHDTRLQPAQMDGLRAFIEAERERRFAQLNDGYALAGHGRTQRR